MANTDRPLSPHLEIYRMQITMLMSIVHRITGVGLYFGVGWLGLWLLCAASGPEAHGTFQAVFNNWFGFILLVGFVWALFHHMVGGLRHFIWDLGKGFDQKSRFALGWATLIGGVVLTLITFVLRGAF